MVRREILRRRLYLRSRNSPVVERSGGYSSGLSNARLRVHKVISSGSQPCFRLVMPKPPYRGWRSPPPHHRWVGVDAEATPGHPSTDLRVCRPCPLFVFVTVPSPVTPDCYGTPLSPKLSGLVLGFEVLNLVSLLSLVVLQDLYAIERIFFDVFGL